MTAALLAPIAALCLALPTAPPIAPFCLDARSPAITREGGLGNLPGFWSFWSNGSLSMRFRASEGGLFRVAARAGGTSALDPATGKRWPEMQLTIDGTVVHTWEVTSSRETPEVYLAPAVRLAAGEHVLSAAYTNDFGANGEDRNLFVSWIGVGPVRAEADTPPLSSEEILLRSAPPTARLNWTFGGKPGAPTWKVAGGAPAAAAGTGLRVVGPAGILSPGLSVPASSASVLSITMAANRGSHGEVQWLTETGVGLASKRFTLRADGRPHVYAIDLDSEASWTGVVRGLVLRPSDAPGAVACIRSINLGPRAVGPADLDCAWFGTDEAFTRAGRPTRIVMSVRNRGYTPAHGVRVRLTTPSGVMITGPAAQACASIDDAITFTWTVRAGRPMSAAIRAQVTAPGLPALTRTSTVSFTAAPRVTRTRPLPDPVAPTTNTLVGAYYFPGWKQGAHTGWTALEAFPERKPVLAWYEEGTPEVADWQIRWAVEHGISFFAFDWYWDRGARSLEHGLHDGFLKSRYRGKMKFCLLWANHNPAGSASVDDLRQVTRFWIDRYFRLPEYQKVDGKPLMILFSPGRVIDDIGVDGTRAAFEEMRGMCRDAGLAGLYIAGCVGPDRASVERMRQAGFDAATGYNYPDAGATPKDGNRPPYASAVEGYTRIWETLHGFGLMDTIPVCDPGWDSRPWAGDDALARTGKDPALFRKMLINAREFAARNPIGASGTRMVLVEAWNEFGEGAAIEPHRQFGFGFLDAIRGVFTNAQPDHDDVVPEDVGQTVPRWRPLARRATWDFRTSSDTLGWGALMGLAEIGIRGGAMRAHVSSSDPAFLCPVDLRADRYTHVVIRMSLSAGSASRLYWGTDHGGPSERNSAAFATVPDGAMHEYVIDLAASPAWRGRIRQLRFDPNDDEAGSDVAIESIRLVSAPRRKEK